MKWPYCQNGKGSENGQKAKMAKIANKAKMAIMA